MRCLRFSSCLANQFAMGSSSKARAMTATTALRSAAVTFRTVISRRSLAVAVSAWVIAVSLVRPPAAPDVGMIRANARGDGDALHATPFSGRGVGLGYAIHACVQSPLPDPHGTGPE